MVGNTAYRDQRSRLSVRRNSWCGWSPGLWGRSVRRQASSLDSPRAGPQGTPVAGELCCGMLGFGSGLGVPSHDSGHKALSLRFILKKENTRAQKG